MKFTRSEILLLGLLATIQFLHIVDFMIIMPLEPQLSRLFHIGPKAFSIIVAAYTFSAGISGFGISFIVDRFDRKTLLFNTFIGFVLGTFACGLAPTYELLVAARILTGIFGGVLSSVVLSIVGDVIPIGRRAQAMGFVMLGFALASIMGVPIGLKLAQIFGWNAPFFVICALSVPVLAMIYFFVPNIKGHLVEKADRITPLETLRFIYEDRNQMNALLLTILMMFGQFSIIPSITPYLVNNVCFPEDKIFMVYLVGGICSVFVSPISGRLADRFGAKKVYTIAAALSTLPILILTDLPIVPEYVVPMVTAMLFIFIGGRMIPAMALITSTVQTQRRGSFMSINSSVQQLAAAGASFMAGSIILKNEYLELQHYNVVGYIAAGSIVASIFVARTLKAVG